MKNNATLLIKSLIFSCACIVTIHAMDTTRQTNPLLENQIGTNLYKLITSQNRWDRANALREIYAAEPLKKAVLKALRLAEVAEGKLYYRGNMPEDLRNYQNQVEEGLFVLDTTSKALLPGALLIVGTTHIPSSEEYVHMEKPSHLLRNQ
jgi:hypothetical protein